MGAINLISDAIGDILQNEIHNIASHAPKFPDARVALPAGHVAVVAYSPWHHHLAVYSCHTKLLTSEGRAFSRVIDWLLDQTPQPRSMAQCVEMLCCARVQGAVLRHTRGHIPDAWLCTDDTVPVTMAGLRRIAGQYSHDARKHCVQALQLVPISKDAPASADLPGGQAGPAPSAAASVKRPPKPASKTAAAPALNAALRRILPPAGRPAQPDAGTQGRLRPRRAAVAAVDAAAARQPAAAAPSTQQRSKQSARKPAATPSRPNPAQTATSTVCTMLTRAAKPAQPSQAVVGAKRARSRTVSPIKPTAPAPAPAAPPRRAAITKTNSARRTRAVAAKAEESVQEKARAPDELHSAPATAGAQSSAAPADVGRIAENQSRRPIRKAAARHLLIRNRELVISGAETRSAAEQERKQVLAAAPRRPAARSVKNTLRVHTVATKAKAPAQKVVPTHSTERRQRAARRTAIRNKHAQHSEPVTPAGPTHMSSRASCSESGEATPPAQELWPELPTMIHSWEWLASAGAPKRPSKARARAQAEQPLLLEQLAGTHGYALHAAGIMPNFQLPVAARIAAAARSCSPAESPTADGRPGQPCNLSHSAAVAWLCLNDLADQHGLHFEQQVPDDMTFAAPLAEVLQLPAARRAARGVSPAELVSKTVYGRKAPAGITDSTWHSAATIPPAWTGRQPDPPDAQQPRHTTLQALLMTAKHGPIIMVDMCAKLAMECHTSLQLPCEPCPGWLLGTVHGGCIHVQQVIPAAAGVIMFQQASPADTVAALVASARAAASATNRQVVGMYVPFARAHAQANMPLRVLPNVMRQLRAEPWTVCGQAVQGVLLQRWVDPLQPGCATFRWLPSFATPVDSNPLASQWYTIPLQCSAVPLSSATAADCGQACEAARVATCHDVRKNIDECAAEAAQAAACGAAPPASEARSSTGMSTAEHDTPVPTCQATCSFAARMRRIVQHGEVLEAKWSGTPAAAVVRHILLVALCTPGWASQELLDYTVAWTPLQDFLMCLSCVTACLRLSDQAACQLAQHLMDLLCAAMSAGRLCVSMPITIEDIGWCAQVRFLVSNDVHEFRALAATQGHTAAVAAVESTLQQQAGPDQTDEATQTS